MTHPIEIVLTAIYDDRSLSDTLGLPLSALAAGRRAGTLRFTRRGHRNFYTGRAVLDWLQADAEPSQAGHDAERQEVAR